MRIEWQLTCNLIPEKKYIKSCLIELNISQVFNW